MNPRIGPASVIDDFLDGYRSELLERELTVEERIIAEEVLFDFITTDIRSDCANRSTRAIDDLRHKLRELPQASTRESEQDLAEIEQRIVALLIAVQRHGHANDIMREHLVMLSSRR